MNRIATSSLVGLAAAMLAATDLSAQMCNGTAAFSTGKMRAGAGLGFPKNGSTFDGEFSVGAKSGYYGGATLSLIDMEGTTEGATGFGLNGGKATTVGATKKVSMCPQLILGITSGPNAPGFEQSTMSLGGGVTFGTMVNASKSFDLIPFGGAFMHRDSFEQTIGTNTAEGSDTNVDLVGGAGFVFSKKWTVRPIITLPLTNDRDATIGVMGSLNFGSK